MGQPNCVLVKVSPEVTLKTHFVRQYFVDKLVANIKQVLRAKSLSGNKIKKGGGRLYIFPSDKKNVSKIAFALSTVFGVQSSAVCEMIESSERNQIVQHAILFCKQSLKSGDSFAIRLRQVGQKNFSSKEVEAEIGSLAMQAVKKLKVDLEHPDKKISIEVLPIKTFFFVKEITGPIGLPLGVEGNVAVFFEGKKSELLAAFLVMKRGCNVFPVISSDSQKLKAHVNKLEKWNSFRKFAFFAPNDLPLLCEKKDIAIKAIVRADKNVSKKFEVQKQEFGVPVFWPLAFFPKELEKSFSRMIYD